MILYPAIDLKDGQAVRLFKGDFDKITVFDNDPGARAKSFADQGFEYLHVVDLDGALKGAFGNEVAIKSIIAATGLPIQLGGGIRTMADIEARLSMGIARVILGTIAARNPDLVRHAARAFPNQVAVGIDAIDGMVAVEGWLETTSMTALDLAMAFEDAGVAAIIATDVGRDGTKTGINVDFTGQLADAVSIPIIASGGLAGIGDIEAIKARSGTKIAGAILGRALYDGLIDPAAALALAAS